MNAPRPHSAVQRILRGWLWTWLGAVVLITPAFYNGYPFVYSDTSTYLSSGFEIETPFDRPITYGLFVRIASLNGLTLWTVILLQSLILAYLIGSVVHSIIPHRSPSIRLMVIGILACGTSLSWICSQVMPDIFTPALVLSAYLLLIRGLGQWRAIGVGFIFLLACSMHLSHIAFCVAFLVAVIILRPLLIRWSGRTFNWRPLLGMLALTGVSILTMGSAMAKSRPIFFMGAMAQHGILKAYLDEYCSTTAYRLCALKDSVTQPAYDFVWLPNAPVERLGGWKAVHDEFTTIINDTFIKPRYIGLHIKASVLATWDQLTRFAIGDGWGSFERGSVLGQRIALYVPADHEQFLNSRQQQDQLGAVDVFRKVHLYTIVPVGLACVLLVCFRPLKGEIAIFLVLVLLGIIVNAWVSGTFANAIDRLGSKMIWMFVLIPLMIIPRPANNLINAR